MESEWVRWVAWGVNGLGGLHGEWMRLDGSWMVVE